MLFEVEQKFYVDDLQAVERQLGQLNAQLLPEQLEEDYYFRHPARDFAVTDEAFRIRRIGDNCWITYKGPKIDAQTKTRREIEIPVGDSRWLPHWQQLLEALGFSLAGCVRKRRRRAKLLWQERPVQVTLDDVEELGQFVEIELPAEETELDRAKSVVASLAQQLGLSRSERRSYLELLFAAKRQ